MIRKNLLAALFAALLALGAVACIDAAVDDDPLLGDEPIDEPANDLDDDFDDDLDEDDLDDNDDA